MKCSRDKISNKVIRTISEYTDVPIDSISESSRLSELGVFSMDTMSILTELEAAYKIELSDWDMAAKELSVHNLIETIMQVCQLLVAQY